ncbi:MAG: hypothetical protein LBQ39_04575, partial [Tannerellaceae bacterium]|nr:hypothetical protein [Tannerellaceae bacterium]
TNRLPPILTNRCIRDPYVQWCERLSLPTRRQGSLLDSRGVYVGTLDGARLCLRNDGCCCVMFTIHY